MQGVTDEDGTQGSCGASPVRCENSDEKALASSPKNDETSPSSSSSSSSSVSSESSDSTESESDADISKKKLISKSLRSIRRIKSALAKAGVNLEVKSNLEKQAGQKRKSEADREYVDESQYKRYRGYEKYESSAERKEDRVDEDLVHDDVRQKDKHSSGRPKFIVRSKVEIERMKAEFDKSHGGPGFRLDLGNMCSQNVKNNPCGFYNINQCFEDIKYSHKVNGIEVNHVCCDCELLFPRLGANHKANSRECPIFLTLQYD